MAVEFIGSIQRWMGLSTDAKPTATKAGSTYHEMDTGKKYIWFMDAWYQDLSMVYAVYQASLGMPETESS